MASKMAEAERDALAINDLKMFFKQSLLQVSFKSIYPVTEQVK